VQEAEQRRIDLVGPLLLDPAAGTADDQLFASNSAARAPVR
jgi:hypothetical protein